MPWNDIPSAKVHRLFYPQIPVVITAEFQGRVGGMPGIWCMPLSFNPLLVGVAVGREHETYRMIESARAFGVNWLDFSYAKQVAELGETSVKDHRDKLSAVGLRTTKGARTSQPIIQQSSAYLECRTRETHPTGTHQLLVAEVISACANESFGDYWDFSKYNPLLYAGTVDGEGKSWVFRSIRGETVTVPLKHPK